MQILPHQLDKQQMLPPVQTSWSNRIQCNLPLSTPLVGMFSKRCLHDTGDDLGATAFLHIIWNTSQHCNGSVCATAVGLHTRYRASYKYMGRGRWAIHNIYTTTQSTRPNNGTYRITLKGQSTMYNTESSHLRRQLYLHRKRPRENWDPTLWEIPFLPLPKRHWDPNEWEVPCDTKTQTLSECLTIHRNDSAHPTLTTSTGNTWGTSHKLNPVC